MYSVLCIFIILAYVLPPIQAVAGAGQGDPCIRIKQECDKQSCYARALNNVWPGLHPRSSFDESKWKKCMRKKCKKTLDFDIDNAKLVKERPFVIGLATVENSEDAILTYQFAASKEIAVTESFTHSHGFNVEAGTEFTTGVPFLAEGKISLSFQQTNNFEVGKTTTKTEKIESTSSISVETKGTWLFKAVLQIAEMNVPYKACGFQRTDWFKGQCGCSTGIWKKTATWGKHLESEKIR